MKRRHRLSARLILLFIGVSILIIITLHIGFRYGIRDEFKQLTEPHLVEYVEHLRSQIGMPPDYLAASELAQRINLDIQINFADNVWSSSGEVLDDNKLKFHTHKLSNGRVVEVSHEEQRFLLRIKEPGIKLLLLTKDSLNSSQLPLVSSFTILAVLGLIALTYHLVLRIFQPIEAIRQGVARFGSGDLQYRITLHRRDELGELAQSINTMAEEIQGMLEAKRQLLLAISHELRSPLTRARLNAELLDESQPRERIVADLQVLEHQLSELLETEQLDSKHAKLDLQPVDPRKLIESVMQEHFINAHLQAQFKDSDGKIQVDPVRIKLLIRNLIENAIRHTPESARSVEILSKFTSLAVWHFQVIDHGEGIPEEHLSYLTEPFYRVDKARQRETGGYGLGLYLCRVIVEAHGGKLEIESKLGIGTRVSVSIPNTAKQG
jgi:signal transduction histidine kinase